MTYQDDLTGRGTPRPRVAFTLVTCAQCGCRLRADDDASGEGWYHFAPLGGRDARGCRIDCSEVAHDRLGVPIAVLA